MKTTEDILKGLASKTITVDQAMAMIAALETSPIGMKMSEKGCVTFTGLPGTHFKFGLSMYPKTVEALFANKDAIEGFLKDNAVELSKRGEASKAASQAVKAAEKAAAVALKKVA